MKTHKFARKPFYVDAVRVSEANIEDVTEWCGGEIKTNDDGDKFIKVKVHRPITERQTEAYIGDWVLWAGNGFKVYTPKAFDKSFEKVRTLSKSQADEAGIKVPHEPRSSTKDFKAKKAVPTPPKATPEPELSAVAKVMSDPEPSAVSEEMAKQPPTVIPPKNDPISKMLRG